MVCNQHNWLPRSYLISFLYYWQADFVVIVTMCEFKKFLIKEQLTNMGSSSGLVKMWEPPPVVGCGHPPPNQLSSPFEQLGQTTPHTGGVASLYDTYIHLSGVLFWFFVWNFKCASINKTYSGRSVGGWVKISKFCTFCTILHILHNFAQFCTFCKILHILHNLLILQIFAHFAQFCTFCKKMHILHNFEHFAQFSIFSTFCTMLQNSAQFCTTLYFLHLWKFCTFCTILKNLHILYNYAHLAHLAHF